MKDVILLILCFLLFAGTVIAILFHEYIRKIRNMMKKAQEEHIARKMAEEDEYFKRTSTKNYRPDDETPKFKDDYFKSTGKQEKFYTRKQTEQKTTTHRTTTDGGVTIIDGRDGQRTDRKIFDDNEGEYVEFEEV